MSLDDDMQPNNRAAFLARVEADRPVARDYDAKFAPTPTQRLRTWIWFHVHLVEFVSICALAVFQTAIIAAGLWGAVSILHALWRAT